MLPRDRVHEALGYRAPDVVPLQVHASPGGLYEHGEKLRELLAACGQDFGDTAELVVPEPQSGDFDADGRYYAVRTDEWDVTWEHRIYGIWGHPLRRPLEDLAGLDSYRAPSPPPLSGAPWRSAREAAVRHRRVHYLVGNGDLLWERLHFLRGYEAALTDVMLDTPEINRIADLITEYMVGCVRHSLSLDSDAVGFADDFGTQQAPLFPLEVWRRFFRPRYERIFEPVRKAGRSIFFHSCGQIAPLLEDLAELGVNAVWPQLPLYDLPELARRCRDLGLAVQLHPDRGDLMQRRPAAEVRPYIERLVRTFRSAEGGSWLYIEIDPGFRFENACELVRAVRDLRGNGA